MSIIPSAAPNNTSPAPLSPEREAEIRELTVGVQHFTAPWSVDCEMTDGYWPVGYSTDNPLAGLIARVPDYGLNVAFFIAESATFVPELLAELDRLRSEQATRVVQLENALAATGRSLSSFIFDSEDPGADALGAQWLYHQAMPHADDPFAQPRAFRSSVFSEASKAVEELDGHTPDDHRERPQSYLDGYSDGLQDAAESLEKLADQAAEGSEVTS